MNLSVTLKKIIIAIALAVFLVVAFLVHALAGLQARPVVFADPPAFVERYAANMLHSEPSSTFKDREADGDDVDGAKAAKQMTNFSYEEALVFDAIMEGKSLDELWRLFAHPDKAQRVKVASALAAVNAEFTHNEESGFPDKRNQFWEDVEEHLPDIRNALSEALIASAAEGSAIGVPYTLAWLPGQGSETLELFAWAAKHHSDTQVREFSLYYLALLGRGEAFTGPTLRERRHDPVYSVRKVALEMRYRRFTGEF